MLSSPSAPKKKRPKRDNHAGTLTEISPRLWRLRVGNGRDPATGRTRQVSRSFHATKAAERGGRGEALDALREFAGEVKAGKHVGSNATFATLADKYLEHVKRTKDDETYKSYRNRLIKSVVPTIGHIRLASLTAFDLDSLYTDLLEDYAASTVDHAHNVISGALTQAMKWGWLGSNVAKLAASPKAQATERVPLSPEQIATLIARALQEHNEDLAVLIYLLCLVGGRRGESAGFQWRDINWTERTIKVERQLVQQAGGQTEKLPKGGKKRIEAIGSAGVEILRAYQGTLARRLGPEWTPQPEGWLISLDGGATATNAHNLSQIIKGLGMRCEPPIDAHPHDCRRFSVSQLLHAGIDPLVIRDRHGHASITTTEGYMLRVDPSDIEAAEVMGDLLLSAGALLVPSTSDD